MLRPVSLPSTSVSQYMRTLSRNLPPSIWETGMP